MGSHHHGIAVLAGGGGGGVGGDEILVIRFHVIHDEGLNKIFYTALVNY